MRNRRGFNKEMYSTKRWVLELNKNFVGMLLLAKEFLKKMVCLVNKKEKEPRSQDPLSLSLFNMHSKMLICFFSSEAMKRREKAQQRCRRFQGSWFFLCHSSFLPWKFEKWSNNNTIVCPFLLLLNSTKKQQYDKAIKY